MSSALRALTVLGHMGSVCEWTRSKALAPLTQRGRGARNHACRNSFGASRWGWPPGLTKNARAISGLFALGFSGIEVGTRHSPGLSPGNPKAKIVSPPGGASPSSTASASTTRDAAAACGSPQKQTWRPGSHRNQPWKEQGYAAKKRRRKTT